MYIGSDIRRFENLHIVFWLIKDTCWMLELKVPGLIMVLPAIYVALHIMIKSWHDNDVFINAGILCWITANSYWMIVEFFFDDKTRYFASVPFALGFFFVAVFYFRSLRQARGADRK